MITIPILLYHCVANDAPSWISPYAVSPMAFAAHLDAILEADRTPVTVSDLCRMMTEPERRQELLPHRPVVITFDDGFADFADNALPAMSAREMVSTLYLTTGALQHLGAPESTLPPARMLDALQLPEIACAGVELAAHSHTHARLDLLPPRRVADELRRPKALLEDLLGRQVASFAYPFGLQTPAIRRAVAATGYTSAAAARNAISSPEDDPLALARLTVKSATSMATVRAWLDGRGAPAAPLPERLGTRIDRCWRRLGMRVGRMPAPTATSPLPPADGVVDFRQHA